jgi:transcription initiation factor TFIIIB Brf1 subunit/transcription initiation factor TFIIB
MTYNTWTIQSTSTSLQFSLPMVSSTHLRDAEWHSTLSVITKLGKKLNFRQRVIATAIVFFRRFYIKNSYCETDPFIVIAACCYVAGKAEESPVHIKNMVAEARLFFSRVFHRQVYLFEY